MPPSPTQIFSGTNEADQSSYTLASITIHANQLQLFAVAGSASSGTVNTPTVSGLNATWVEVTSIGLLSPERKLFLFRTMVPSDETGQITVNWGGQTQERLTFSLVEFDGVDTSGTNGSGAIEASVTASDASVTTLTITFAAYASSNNRPYAAFRFGTASGESTNGWTQLSLDSPTNMTHFTMWNDATDDTTATATWTTSSSFALGIGVEVKAASAGGQAPRSAHQYGLRRRV